MSMTFTPFFRIVEGAKMGDLVGWRIPSGGTTPPFEFGEGFALDETNPFSVSQPAQPNDIFAGFAMSLVVANSVAAVQQRQFLLGVGAGGDGGPGPLQIPVIYTTPTGITGATVGPAGGMPLTLWRPLVANLIEVESGNANYWAQYGISGTFPTLIDITGSDAINVSTAYGTPLTMRAGAWSVARDGEVIRGYFARSVTPIVSPSNFRCQIEVTPVNTQQLYEA